MNYVDLVEKIVGDDVATALAMHLGLAKCLLQSIVHILPTRMAAS